MLDRVIKTSYDINRFTNKNFLGGKNIMTNAQYPDFKAGFKYQNIGNIVGTLNYAKAMKRKDDSEYGIEFLINARGFGSINVRIPMMDRAQSSLDNYSVSDKPRVRAGLARIEQFVADNGRVYTNATTFVELSDATTASGEPMKDNIAGRVGGEVFNIQQIQGSNAIKFSIVSYSVDRKDESKRATTQDGTPLDPQVLTFEAHDPNVINQIQQTVRQGSNVEVGYKYLNKSNVQYDEYGFAINGGNSDVIERLEAGKIVVHGAPQQQQQGGFGGGFGQQQQGGFGGQQQQGFGQQPPQQQQQQQGFGQQQQQQGNAFGSFGNQGQQQQQQQGFGGGQPDLSGSQNNFGVPDNQMPFNQSYQQPQGGQQGFGQQQQGFGADPFAGAQELQQGSPAYEEAQKMFGQGNQNGNGFGFGS